MTYYTLTNGPFHPAPENLEAAISDGGFEVEASEALTTPWDQDAHFLLYSISYEDVRLPVRITKEVSDRPRLTLSDVRQEGFSVLVHTFGADLDREPHEPWESAEQALGALQAAREACEAAGWPPSAAYTTRAGLRLLWTLTTPIDPEAAESRMAGFLLTLHQETGLRPDHGCLDWTRLLRLPDVLRDDVQQGQEPWFQLDLNPEATLEARGFPEQDVRQARRQLKTGMSVAGKAILRAVEERTFQAAYPDEEEALELAWVGGELTPWAQIIDRTLAHENSERLKSQQAWTEGSRDTELTRMAGDVVGSAARIDGSSPEAVFGLMLPLLYELEPDEGTPDWLAKGWSLIQRFWAHDKPQQEQATEERQARRTDFLGQVRDANLALLEDADDEAIKQFVENFSVVGLSPTACFHMQSDGTYCSHPRRWGQSVRNVVGSDEINGYAWKLRTEEGNPLWQPKHFDRVGRQLDNVIFTAKGPWGLSVDPSNGEHLNLRIHEVVTDLDPVYHEEIDTWLKTAFQEDWNTAERYLKYVSYADRPICGIILLGAPQTGKSLLGAALGRLFNERGPVRDLGTSRFNDELLHQPVVLYDETAPPTARDVKRIDAMLREWIIGGSMPIERKNMPIFKSVMFPRFVFTGNNEAIVEQILGRRDLNLEDQQALAERLFICRFSPATRKPMQLAKKVFGLNLDIAVAEHLLWMRTTADFSDVNSSERLLVKGSTLSNAFIEDASIRSNETFAILQGLIDTVALLQQKESGDRLYLSSALVSTELLKRRLQDESVSERDVHQTLRRAGIVMQRAISTYIDETGTSHRKRSLRIPLVDLFKSVITSDLDVKISAASRAQMERHDGRRWEELQKSMAKMVEKPTE